MIQATGFDMSGLEFSFRGLHNALLGTGQTGGTMRQFLKVECRQLANEIATQLGPKTLDAGRVKIVKDLRALFHPMATKSGDDWNLFFGQKAGNGDTRWLYSGPNFLTGVERSDFAPQLSATGMNQILKESRQTGRVRGKAWNDKATRGKQHVIILDRIAVRKSQFEALADRLMKRLGRLKSTFGSTAQKLGKVKVPAWVSRHFSAVDQDGAAVFNAGELADPNNPAIIFGSRAIGVESNPRIRKTIQSAIKTREQISIAKMRKVLTGMAYDFNTGGVYKPRLEDN